MWEGRPAPPSRKARQAGLLIGLTSCVRRLISTLLAALPVYPAPVNALLMGHGPTDIYTERHSAGCTSHL